MCAGTVGALACAAPSSIIPCAMMVLRDAIRELLDKADRWRGQGINEADTKALFIEPVLGVLGWDVRDLDVVRREFRVYDNTLLDYALMVSSTPRLFVEAKPLGKSLDDKQFIAQTVNYANNEGVVWCVLTDGLKYRVYKSNEPADMERKLLFEVDLEDARDDSSAEEVVRRLTYLSRDSIESGSLDEWGESTFTDVRVKSAVMGLLTNPSTRMVNMVLDKLDGGTALPREKVKDSLRRMATLLSGDVGAQAVIPSAPPSSAPTAPTPRAGWTALDKLVVTPRQNAPAQIRWPDGTSRPLKAWKYLLVEVAACLVSTGALGPQHCPIRTRPANKRFLVHTDARHPTGKPFTMPVQVGSLWVETHASATNLYQQALFLIRHARKSPSSFHVL